MKKCCKCKKSKNTKDFGFNKSSKTKDGIHPECRECVRERKAVYYARNKHSVNAAGAIYKRTRRAVDISVRIKDTLRSRLRMAIKGNQKKGSAVSDLGCSIPFLKDYLKTRFKSGMNWNNYGKGRGKWNIDHIIPLSRFNLEDRKQILIACNFSNLQPLWTEENLRKSDN
jgi:hypothetical protein